MIKQIDITPEVLQKVTDEVNKFYVSNNYSINNHNQEKQIQSNLVGKLGEYFYHELFPDSIRIDCYDYDYIHGGLKVDVKTKLSAGKIEPFYTCDIPAYQVKNQKTDEYFFFIVNKNLTKINIIGRISKDEFLKQAKFFKKDTLVERNGYKYRVDTYSILVSKIGELNEH